MVTRNIKSALTNQIFKQEMLHTYEQKSQSRDELVREARKAIRKLTQEMAKSICTEPAIEQKMEQLARQLETVKGQAGTGAARPAGGEPVQGDTVRESWVKETKPKGRYFVPWAL